METKKFLVIPLKNFVEDCALCRLFTLNSRASGIGSPVEVWTIDVDELEQIIPALHIVEEALDDGTMTASDSKDSSIQRLFDALHNGHTCPPPLVLVQNAGMRIGRPYLNKRICLFLKGR